MDWLDLLAVQGTLKSLSENHSSKHQFFGTQPLLWYMCGTHPYMIARKNITLTRWTFVGKVMSLLKKKMLCRLVIAFLPRSRHLLI